MMMHTFNSRTGKVEAEDRLGVLCQPGLQLGPSLTKHICQCMYYNDYRCGTAHQMKGQTTVLLTTYPVKCPQQRQHVVKHCSNTCFMQTPFYDTLQSGQVFFQTVTEWGVKQGSPMRRSKSWLRHLPALRLQVMQSLALSLLLSKGNTSQSCFDEYVIRNM